MFKVSMILWTRLCEIDSYIKSIEIVLYWLRSFPTLYQSYFYTFNVNLYSDSWHIRFWNGDFQSTLYCDQDQNWLNVPPVSETLSSFCMYLSTMHNIVVFETRIVLKKRLTCVLSKICSAVKFDFRSAAEISFIYGHSPKWKEMHVYFIGTVESILI